MEPLHRCGRALSRPVKRLAVASGFVLVGWALGAVLGTTASADELPTGFDGGGTVSAISAASANTGTDSATGTNSASGTNSAQSNPAPAEQPSPKKKANPQSNGGLLGGLLSSLAGTVGSTLNTTVTTLTSTVSTVIGTMGGTVDTVIAPITGGGTISVPSTLPLVGDLLPNGDSGGTVTNTVSANESTAGATTSQPKAPQPTAPANDTPVVVNHVKTAVAARVGPHVAAKQVAVDQPPAQSDKRFSAPTGGTGGGGDVPAAPSSPAAPTTITASHDSSGGARQLNAVLGSSANTTQLRLFGTSLDHEVDGAGRDAALPTTSPD
jgi:hypothetical protein